MTVTITPRRAVVASLAVLALATALVIVYAIGATHSAASSAASPGQSGGRSAGSPGVASALFGSNQPSAAPGIAGPGITVGGRANVTGTPDTLRLDLSVTVTASSVSDALASANRAAAAVQKSLLGNGVAKKDLQTSGLNIQPEYDYSNNASPRIKGYQVSESISAKLRDLGRAGDVIGKAVTTGGNAVRVNGISLDLEETGALVSTARGKAFADAKAKAEQYAAAAGRSLGNVVTIAEDVATPSPAPMSYGLSATSAKDMASVPIQPGSQDVSVSVTVVFEIR